MCGAHRTVASWQATSLGRRFVLAQSGSTAVGLWVRSVSSTGKLYPRKLHSKRLETCFPLTIC